MWFSALILFHDRQVEKTEILKLAESISLPKVTQRLISQFTSSEGERRICEEFAKFVTFVSQDIKNSHYGDVLTFLAEKRSWGASKASLKKEMEILTKFLRYLWKEFGKEGDPLQGENPMEDIDWLDDWHEEVVVLIKAKDEDEAWEKAEALGKKWADEYNKEGYRGIQREFVGVLTVQEIIDKVGNGAEVFSRFLTTKEAKGLLRRYRINA